MQTLRRTTHAGIHHMQGLFNLFILANMNHNQQVQSACSIAVVYLCKSSPLVYRAVNFACAPQLFKQYLAMLALMGQYLLILTTDQMSMYLCLELQSFSLVASDLRPPCPCRWWSWMCRGRWSYAMILSGLQCCAAHTSS
jgi:hypothetical protein